jgi:hypothetical protein
MCNYKSHDLLLLGPDRSPETHLACQSESGHRLTSRRASYPQAQPNQGPLKLRRQMECRDRIGTKWISNIDTDCRSNSSRPHLLAAKAHRGANTYTRDEAGSGISADRRTPLVRALALHGVSEKLGSHLGSTLNPGGAVLTLGVFRRSRSVAYIPADASPSEVLASVIVPPRVALVNPTRRTRAIIVDSTRRNFSLYCWRRVANSTRIATLQWCRFVAAGRRRAAVSGTGLPTAFAPVS